MEATIQKAIDLQRKLHRIPEASGCERETKKALIEFLNAEGDLEIIDRGKWFYAAHREQDAEEGIALRADMDAVTGADGKPFHGCGHDGHSSVMAALAASVKGKKLGKNLFFLFQHAEETGAGGAECCEIFDREKIDAIYGFHNCPGFPAGTVLLLHDTFACASKGLILRFDGSQTHAAHPENGRNPIFPMAAFFEGCPLLRGCGGQRGDRPDAAGLVRRGSGKARQALHGDGRKALRRGGNQALGFGAGRFPRHAQRPGAL